MTTNDPTRNESIDVHDYALPCLDIAHEFAGDELLADFEAWSAARQCSTDTLRRFVNA